MSRIHSDPWPDDDRSLVERVTHDLLNPIASLLGLGETLRSRGSDLDDETLRSFGDSIARQATRLEAMIRDLTRATRLLRDDVVVEMGDVAAEKLLEAFASERVRVLVPGDLTFRADPELLASALRRLVDNALEFSAGGEIVVRAEAGVIEISDRGPGFPGNALSKPFEPLTAGLNTRNERGPGLGLGLFIARKLIEAQGGRLSATSVPGEGSVFRIELPA